jgi:hypothetical protein
MLTSEQKDTLKLFLRYPDPGVESSRDVVDEIRDYKLRGRQSQQRDRAVALYYHRLRMTRTMETLPVPHDTIPHAFARARYA